MSRILVLGVVGLLLFGGILAADQALQNPDLEPATAAAADEQQQFAETNAELVEAAAPVGLFALAAALTLMAARAVGG